MKMFFIVKGLGRGLDALMVESDAERVFPLDSGYNAYPITRIYNVNQIVGDRNVSFPLAGDGIWISDEFLQRCEDPILREFDSKNPWGKWLSETSAVKGDLHIATAKYERALQVTVSEGVPGKRKTLFSDYFFKNAPQAEKVVIDHVHGIAECDQLPLELRYLKEAEANG